MKTINYLLTVLLSIALTLIFVLYKGGVAYMIENRKLKECLEIFTEEVGF